MGDMDDMMGARANQRASELDEDGVRELIAKLVEALTSRSVISADTTVSMLGALDQVAKVSGYLAMVSAMVYLVATFAMKPKSEATLNEETPILSAA